MRACGILLPIFSLSGPYGIGTMGRAAYDFVDFLAAARQAYWQILPIGPTGYGDSPYQSFSAFAGNPYLIDPDGLVRDGLLTGAEAAACAAGSAGPSAAAPRIDYAALYKARPLLLQTAVSRLLAAGRADYATFCEKNAAWLEDYALFMAIKRENGEVGLSHWPAALRSREPEALGEARQRLAAEIEFHKAVQYLFYIQWDALKAYANQKGVRIVGDIPIYVSPDSSDLWANPELFQTDEAGRLSRVAGCPPDAFSATGQLWGNPLYNWPRHEATGFAWWQRRMRHATHIYDVVRIDHFRGFESYYSIPGDAVDATSGCWCKGPAMALISAIRAANPNAAIIAEDLGYQTPEVRRFLAESGLPGMKVLQFAFDSREQSDYLPYHYTRNSVVYTGTHDNDTTESWQHTARPEDVAYACRYLACSLPGLTRAMVRAALSCVSDTCIIPYQDWLALSGEARINTPSTLSGNWCWRMSAPPDKALAEEIAAETLLYGRA